MTSSLPADAHHAQGVVIVGSFAHTSFAPLLRQVTSLVGSGQVRAYGSVRLLLDSDSVAPTAGDIGLLLVLQSWPEEYTQTEVLDLLDRYPLARLLVCYGPWCDSDGRTRQRWPRAIRVPLAQAESRVREELQDLRARAPSIPLTASRDESFARVYSPLTAASSRQLRVAVKTPDPAVRDWLNAWIRTLDWSVHSKLQTNPGPDVLIWDVDPWSADTAAEMGRFRRQCPQLPIVGLIGFARDHDTQQLQGCGVDSVLTKTSPMSEWRNVIEAVVDVSDCSQPQDLRRDSSPQVAP
jgi:hypothetical protein